MNVDFGVFLVTAPDKETAEKISTGLVEGKLAACVNVLEISSVYRWEDKVEKADEHLLVIKSRLGLYPEIIEFVKQTHPHEVPETIALPIFHGAAAYMDWLGANTLLSKEIMTIKEGG